MNFIFKTTKLKFAFISSAAETRYLLELKTVLFDLAFSGQLYVLSFAICSEVGLQVQHFCPFANKRPE